VFRPISIVAGHDGLRRPQPAKNCAPAYAINARQVVDLATYPARRATFACARSGNGVEIVEKNLWRASCPLGSQL
jgi:hypothetical protein